MLEAGELLPGAEVVAVSAVPAPGWTTLRAALDRVAAHAARAAPRKRQRGSHVDRVFTIRGAGTVVTGTLWSGAVGRGDELALLPGGGGRGSAGSRSTTRRSSARGRTAGRVNLVGLAVSELARAMSSSARHRELREAYLLDAELEFGAREPEHGARVQVHHGTREAPARLAWLGGPFWQLRLEQPLIATPATES